MPHQFNEGNADQESRTGDSEFRDSLLGFLMQENQGDDAFNLFGPGPSGGGSFPLDFLGSSSPTAVTQNAGGIGSSILGALQNNPIVQTGVAALAQQLFGIGDPSASQQQSLDALNRVAGAEATSIEQQVEIAQMLLDMATGGNAAGSGILGATGGQGLQLPREAGGQSNASDIFGQINFDEILKAQRLQEASGSFPGSTGATSTLAGLTQNNINSEQDAYASFVQSIINATQNRRAERQRGDEFSQLLGLFGSGQQTG